MKTNQNQTCRPATAKARLTFVLALTLWLGCLPGLLAQGVPDRLNYQGILLKGDGTPVPAVPTDVEFRIWDLPENGTLLWGRTHRLTPDTSGAFNVVLMEGGSPITAGSPAYTSLAPVFTGTGSDSRYLELTVAGSTAIRPRQRFVASPYAFLAQNVVEPRPNFSVSGVLTVNGAANVGSLTSAGVVSAASANVGSLTASGGTVTASNFVGFGTIPIGGIIMWSGAITNIPNGWALCDGNQGRPDLRGRFVLSYGNGRTNLQTGGQESVVLNISQIPSHTHKTLLTYDRWPDNPWRQNPDSGNHGFLADPDNIYGWSERDFETSAAGQSSPSPVTTMPPYCVLAYIMRVK